MSCRYRSLSFPCQRCLVSLIFLIARGIADKLPSVGDRSAWRAITTMVTPIAAMGQKAPSSVQRKDAAFLLPVGG